MKNEIFVHKDKSYNINVSDLNAGGCFGEATWKVIATDKHNESIVETTLEGILGNHIQKEFGKTPAEFLIEFAKSEIVRTK